MKHFRAEVGDVVSVWVCAMLRLSWSPHRGVGLTRANNTWTYSATRTALLYNFGACLFGLSLAEACGQRHWTGSLPRESPLDGCSLLLPSMWMCSL